MALFTTPWRFAVSSLALRGVKPWRFAVSWRFAVWRFAVALRGVKPGFWFLLGVKRRIMCGLPGSKRDLNGESRAVSRELANGTTRLGSPVGRSASGAAIHRG